MTNKFDYLNHASGPIQYGLTNDYMFRAVLQESNETLKLLLSALLPIPYEEIIECVITNPIILGESIDDKTCIMDVRVKLNNNRLINLEMQMGHLDNWCNRALFYLCRLFCNIKSGQDYSQLLPAIHIGILSDPPFSDMDDFYSEYLLTNTRHPHIFSRNFSLRMLNLNQLENATENERVSELYHWACLFRAKTWEDIRMIAENNNAIREAASHLKILSEKEKIQQQAESRERYFMDMSCSRNEGIAEGYSKGSAEGYSRGSAEGYSKGSAEGYSKGSADAQKVATQLALLLVQDGRIADLERIASDPVYYQELLKEYGLD